MVLGLSEQAQGARSSSCPGFSPRAEGHPGRACPSASHSGGVRGLCERVGEVSEACQTQAVRMCYTDSNKWCEASGEIHMGNRLDRNARKGTCEELACSTGPTQQSFEQTPSRSSTPVAARFLSEPQLSDFRDIANPLRVHSQVGTRNLSARNLYLRSDPNSRQWAAWALRIRGRKMK